MNLVRSGDNGAFYDSTINLSKSANDSRDQQIAVCGKNVYIVWTEIAGITGSRDIYLTQSTDGGTTFGNPINLSNNPGDSAYPQIAALGNSVYVVWYDSTSGNGDIYFRVNHNSANPSSWLPLITSPALNLSPNLQGSSERPQIAVSQNSFSGNKNVYVVWHDRSSGLVDIYFAKSNTDGTSFDNPVNLSGNNGESGQPVVSASESNVYVSWHDTTTSTGNYDIFYKKSGNEGTTFGNPINLSNNPGNSMVPQMVTSDTECKLVRFNLICTGGDVYVVWQDDTPVESDIFYSYSADRGDTFRSTPINLTNDLAASVDPNIALDTEFDEDPFDIFVRVFVVWETRSPLVNPHLSFVEGIDRRDLGDMDFDFPSNLQDFGNPESNPMIATSGTNLYVVGQFTNLPESPIIGGSTDVSFKVSIGVSATRFGHTVFISNNPGNSEDPKIALSLLDGNTHIVWSDDEATANYEIYYKRVT